MNKLLALVFAAAILVLTPGLSQAMGLEAAVGGWRQAPSGELGYEPVTDSDLLDLEDDFDYEEEYRLSGRLKLDLPLFLPNIALMYTPMRFDSTGETDFSFSFGGETFSANQEFSSEVQLDHYDVGLYYGIPLLETATLDMLKVELGLNGRIFDISAEIDQPGTGLSESVSETQVLPMVYVGAFFQPLDAWALEVEARGVAYNGDSLISLLGRLKYEFFDPFFCAAGYRYDTVDLEEEDIEADVIVQGPFVEIGLGL